MLVVFCTITFGSVQIGYKIMSMGEERRRTARRQAGRGPGVRRDPCAGARGRASALKPSFFRNDACVIGFTQAFVFADAARACNKPQAVTGQDMPP
jgi:hypothetical protein